MMSNDAFWSEEESSPAIEPGIVAFGNAIRIGPGKGMPVLSRDGRVTFLVADEQEDLLDKKLGSVLCGKISGSMNLGFRQPYLKSYCTVGTPEELNVVGFLFGPSHSKGYPTHTELSEDDVRRQILEALNRKGVSVAAPTKLELATVLPQETAAATAAACTPSLEVFQLQDRVKFLEAQLRSTLPYLQMYKFGAGSLLVAVISLLVWVVTGAGVPFHPVFAVMVIPAAIGLMVMAFLVRRDIPNPPSRQS
jgi:hypothetical protein